MRTIGGSLARSWPPPLPRRRRRCVLLLLLLGLSAATNNNRCAVFASAVCECLTLSFTLLCACSRTQGASLCKLGERHASCDIHLSLLLQLRLLRVLRVLLRAAAVPAAAAAAASAANASTCCRRSCCCCCCLLSWILGSRSPGGAKQSLRNEMGQPIECSLLDL